MTALRSRLLPAALLPVLLLAGCASADDEGTVAAPEPTRAPAPSEAPSEEPSSEPPAVAPGATLRGVVGEPDDPDAFTITLTDDSGTPVTELPAGSYTIEVEDPSDIHNWRLTGPGVDEATGVEEVTSASFSVTLAPGTYTYVCDPHPSMVGELVVV